MKYSVLTMKKEGASREVHLLFGADAHLVDSLVV
jgi:hypothetical protein